MIGLLFFAWHLSAMLKDGDNPYQILGISKKATKQEIKSAYRKLTIQYHPDSNKDPKASEIWIKVNDAYELLTDPDRKAIYDRYGLVDEKEFTTADLQHSQKDFRFFTYEEKQQRDRKLKKITTANYDNFTSTKGEYMFLIYSSIIGDNEYYLDMFEEFSVRFQKLIKCGIIDTAYNSELAKRIGAIREPSFFYMNTKENKVARYEKEIRTFRQITDFWTSQWKHTVPVLKTPSELKAFLNNDPTSPHIVQAIRTENPTIYFRRSAERLHSIYHFAAYRAMTIEDAKFINVTTFPQMLFYRNPELKPIKANEMKDLIKVIQQYDTPTLFEVDPFSFGRLCKEICYVRSGKPNQHNADQLVNLNVTTAWTAPDSKFARTLLMKEGEWVAILPPANRYIRVETRLDDYVSLRTFRDEFDVDSTYLIEIPANFGIDMTFAAFIREARRFLFFAREPLISALPYFGIALLFVLIDFVVRYVKKIRQDKKKELIDQKKLKKKNVAKKVKVNKKKNN